MFEAGDFDVATLVYNQFKSVISQVPTEVQLIPLPVPEQQNRMSRKRPASPVYEFEPDEETILERGCCRRTWPFRSTAPCWKATPVSMARK